MPQEPNTPQFDVFLSHNNVDKPWAAQLKADLHRYGLSAWLDQDEIRPGNLIVTDLEAALDNSQAVALIVSPEAMASGWVREEYARAVALAQDKQRQLQLIPVILRGAELPGFLANRNWVDFRDEAAYSQSVWKLVWGITGHKPGHIRNLSGPDLSSSAPDQPLAQTLTQPLEIYLNTMIRFYRHLPLGALDPVGGRESAQITLGSVYVSLNVKAPLEVTLAGQAGEIHSVLGCAARWERLVVLGDPGSGKSTFLRFLALRLAEAWLQPESNWQAHLRWPIYARDRDRAIRSERETEKLIGEETWSKPYLPVLVTLRDFAAQPFDPHSPLALWQFIENDLARYGLADTVAAVREVLRRGEGIFLFDGVDEVPLARRPQVWRAIGALAQSAFNGCPWIATCRHLSYNDDEAAPAEVTGQVTLAALNKAQIETFVTAWYQALQEAGAIGPIQAENWANQLKRAVLGKLRHLAENPMLLTIMALVQTSRATLPEERVRLYQACVQTLLFRWQEHKEQAEGELPLVLAELGLKQEILAGLLAEIGWVAHAEQASRQGEAADIPAGRVLALARYHLKDAEKAAEFVKYTEQRAHLLVGRGGQTDLYFSFPHRTFQEYLAACHLIGLPDFGDEAGRRAEMGGSWREVLLMAAETLVYNHQAVGRNTLLLVLRDILPENHPDPGDTPSWQRVWRAGEMLAVIGPAEAGATVKGEKLLRRVRADLSALLTGGELTPPERAEAGRTLAILGDSRPGVGVKDGLPDIVWCEVKAGSFIMGSNEGSDNEKPAHSVILPIFQISQYPVTNAQFNLFVEAGGYEVERYWPEAKKAGYWHSGRFKGGFTRVVRDQPYNSTLSFNLPNHPAVELSWYEAVAFCRWCSEKLGRLIRLPTEAEWEKAARGSDGRRYPWGFEEEIASRCNIAKTGIGTTSAVGMFLRGASFYGVLDMNGNMWEWCSTIWGHAYPFQVTEEWTEAYLSKMNTGRVLRGGSFVDPPNIVYCSNRSGSIPNGAGLNVGFRVVCDSSK